MSDVLPSDDRSIQAGPGGCTPRETHFTVVIEPLEEEDDLDPQEARRFGELLADAVAGLSDDFLLRARTEESPGPSRMTTESAGGDNAASRGALQAGLVLSMRPEQLSAAGGFIAREWGDDGYRIEAVTSPTWLVSVFDVVSGDGSRFAVAADRYGNTRALPDDPAGRNAAVAEMHRAASLP